MAGKIKGITIEIGGNLSGFNKAMSSADSSARSLQRELKQVEAALKLDPKNTELLTQKQKLLNESVTDTKTKLELLKETKAKVDTAMDNGTEVSAKQYEKLQREIVFTEDKLKNLEKQSKLSTDKISAFGDNMKTAGSKMTSAGTKGFAVTGVVAGIGIAGGKMALEFEDAMANINTLLDDESHLQGYEDTVKLMSDQTGIDLDTMSQGMYQTISSIGDNGDVTKKIFETMARSAKAGGADVADSVSLISAGMKGYNQVNDETAKKISDLGFQTAKLGVTTFPEMAKSMQPLFPLASSLNMSYEELFAVMATGTGVTGNTAEVTTQLKAVMSGLMKPTADMQKLIEKYGFANAGAMIESNGLAGTLQILQTETGGQSDKLATLFGSTEALTLSTALTGTQFDTFKEKLGAMDEATGSTDTAYGKLNTTADKVRISTNKAKNSFTELGSKLIETLLPTIEKICGIISKLCDWFNSLDDGTKKTIIVVGLIAAAIPILLIVLGSLATGIGAVTSALTFLCANPIVMIIIGIVAAIAALVAGFVYLWNHVEGFRLFWINLWEGIKTTVSVVVDALKIFFTQTIPNAWQAVVDFFAGIPEWWSNLWNGVKTTITNVFDTIKNTIQGWINNITGFFTGLWDKVVSIFTNMGDSIKNKATGIGESIKNGFNSAIEWIKNLPSQALEWGKDFIMGLVDGIKNAVHFVTDAVKGVANDIKSFLHFSVPDVGPLTDYETWMPDFMQGLASGIEKSKGLVTSAISKLSTEMQINPNVSGFALSGSNSSISTTNQNDNRSEFVVKIEKFVNNTSKDVDELTMQMLHTAEEYKGRKGETA